MRASGGSRPKRRRSGPVGFSVSNLVARRFCSAVRRSVTVGPSAGVSTGCRITQPSSGFSSRIVSLPRSSDRRFTFHGSSVRSDLSRSPKRSFLGISPSAALTTATSAEPGSSA